ncbi:hypothetical protein THIOKS12540040 [Thiocapsa sp. KS1]|nr:hypothetical protein THIOKS12540040 [Thiocapsa sp. KS1]
MFMWGFRLGEVSGVICRRWSGRSLSIQKI